MKARHLMKLLGAVLAFTLLAAACADSDDDSETTQETAATAQTVAASSDTGDSGDDEPDGATDDGPAASEPDDEGTTDTVAPEEAAADEPAPEPRRIAYLSASSANTFLLASVGEMQRLADENNIEIVEFDAQFNAELQTTQLQDVIASGQYDGIILVALNGPGLVPDVEAALAGGMQVVLFNQIVGADLSTNEPQVDGIAASVLAPPVVTGERAGRLTIQACEGLDPCRVVYFFGIRGIPLDVALRQGFDSVVVDHPSIQVVAEGEGQYLGPERGINAIQDILQVQPEFDVVVGADQSLQGVELVLTEEGMLGDVALIGLGGSSPAVEGVRVGRWFATVFYAPASEGRLAMEAMIAALADGTITGGVDPNAGFLDEGLVTSANVDQFTAEWDG